MTVTKTATQEHPLTERGQVLDDDVREDRTPERSALHAGAGGTGSAAAGGHQHAVGRPPPAVAQGPVEPARPGTSRLFDASAFMLDGRVAIVTGGAGGIGAATVRLMVARGARVAIADLDHDRACGLAREFGDAAIGLSFDLEDAASIAAMVEQTVTRFGRLDILDNNAAFLDPKMAERDRDVEAMDIEVWDKTMSVNLRGTMLACKAALPHLRASGAGAIVNTVSNLALQGHVIQAAYAASKAAIIQLTRSIAASHGRSGVRCNAVAPGMTMTPALRDAFPPSIRKLVEDETLRPQLGDPEDIAEAVAFLASDAARNITGQCLVSDGGLSSHVPGIAGFMQFGSPSP